MGGRAKRTFTSPGPWPLNFLVNFHSSRPRSGVHLHQYCMETAPVQKKIDEKVGVAKSTSSLLKSQFFSGKNADFAARAARFFRKFWRSSGAKRRDLSLGFKASEKSEGTLPVQCDHSEAIPGVRGTPKRPLDRLFAILKNYLVDH